MATTSLPRQASFTLEPGASYRVTKAADTYPVVDVPPDVAARCRYNGRMRLIEGNACIIFVDPVTGDEYGQVAPD